MKIITRESYAKRIERVLHYIVDHLDDVGENPLDIHRLAEEAFLSPYHFHRVYVAMMGETVADTLRRHRLHRASIKLSASATPIAALATEAGYGSAQAFTRAFREAYGIPPAQYRLHGQLSAALQLTPTSIKLKEHPMFNLKDVHIQNLPAIHIAKLQHKGDFQAIGSTFERLMVWAAGQGLMKAGTRTFGIYYDDPKSKPADELRSDACVEIPPQYKMKTSGHPDIAADKTSSGRAAVFVFTGPYSELENPYRWLYDTWLPQSNEEPRNEAPFEEYLNDARNTPPAELKTAICIPLKG
jgi:AraC family transcriptional regulator